MFFVIPVGHESSTVRRQPWVSYSIIVLNVLIYFLFTHSALNQRETQHALREVLRYAIEHPSTELDPEIKNILPPHILEKFRQARLQLEGQRPTRQKNVFSFEQDQLDQLTEEFLALYRSDSYQRWGYIPAREGRLYTLLTCMFFHGGLMHLLGNIFIFFLSGPFVEDRWGRTLFGGFYLISGVVSALIHGKLTGNPYIPMVGASGAIAGVMGAFLVLFLRTKIRFLYVIFIYFRFLKGTFDAPAYLVLPLWLAQQYFNAISATSSGVAFWSHVGGFLFGVAFAVIIKLSRVEERFISPSIEDQITLYKTHPLFEKALAEFSAGNLEEAKFILQNILKDEPDDVSAMNKMFEIHVEERDAEALQKMGSKLLTLSLKDNDLDHAVVVFQGMKADQSQIYPEPQPLFNLAVALEKEKRTDYAFWLYEELAKVYPTHLLALKSLVKLGEINLQDYGDAKRAFSFFVLAKHHPAVDQHLAVIIETGIKKARAQGGEPLARMEEADVEGLERYKEPLSEPVVHLSNQPVELVGLGDKGIKIRDEQRKSVRLAWPEIVFISIAAIEKEPTASKEKGERVIIIDLFRKETADEAEKGLNSFRIDSDRLPIESLFKKDVPVIKACMTLITFIKEHTTCPSIPSEESLKRLKLPVYHSLERYEESVGRKIMTLDST
jgi:membrane associated rhomboid family serine protease